MPATSDRVVPTVGISLLWMYSLVIRGKETLAMKGLILHLLIAIAIFSLGVTAESLLTVKQHYVYLGGPKLSL